MESRQRPICFQRWRQRKPGLPTLVFIPLWSSPDTWLLSAPVALLLLWPALRLQRGARLHRQRQAHEEKVFLLLLQLVFYLIISLQDGTVKEATSSWPISSKPAFYFTTLVLRHIELYLSFPWHHTFIWVQYVQGSVTKADLWGLICIQNNIGKTKISQALTFGPPQLTEHLPSSRGL